ncbi:Spp1p NDAI_0E02300 [Naumovozyma dairenensis CBS 421]|uniref:PHD-type domain-containing protein n=1 Tax=Naumovozyma dairenensis (strain ATCC 10597 / BCRC 20456 / CBS 421 / NBRC 0211 / NRRL Y-12639) TaxID=1071378 RepID=G0WBC7_NAUDC|nr:hypothetical protein NDAI_0E02300 [Naumovozyma dairenensis CBS 421]CCD25047.1 hypothetical protein NDAI_0E02300 [Naumovozyma dairenensis CBS 421]
MQARLSSLPVWCPPYSKTKKDPITGEDVYCICKKQDTGELMVGCDGCDDWFHFSCMRIPIKYQKLVASFYCPYCQAGITGMDKSEAEEKTVEDETGDAIKVRKTLWKKKCRLEDCYEPCTERSKYCSRQHGKEFLQEVLSKLDISGLNVGESVDKEAFVKTLIQQNDRDDFQSFIRAGQSEFIDKDVPKSLDNQLYESLIANDRKVNELINQQSIIETGTLPKAKERVELLEKYIDWISQVNIKFNEDQNSSGTTDENSSSKIDKGGKKSKKKKGLKTKPKKRICGYISNFTELPSSVDKFVEEYELHKDDGLTTLQSVCIKTRCIKHSEWSSMLLDRYLQEVELAERHQERIQLLLQTRKRQLHIQYYEKVTKKQS